MLLSYADWKVSGAIWNRVNFAPDSRYFAHGAWNKKSRVSTHSASTFDRLFTFQISHDSARLPQWQHPPRKSFLSHSPRMSTGKNRQNICLQFSCSKLAASSTLFLPPLWLSSLVNKQSKVTISIARETCESTIFPRISILMHTLTQLCCWQRLSI